jgi:hypothetical protein
MANTTITVNGVTITLHGDGYSVMQENDVNKEAILTPMPLYGQDSSGTDIFDFGGVIKTITFSGEYVHDTGVTALKTWVDSVEALIQGHQDAEAGYPATLVDDLRGTVKVKIMNFTNTWLQASPTSLTWTLKVMEASQNA